MESTKKASPMLLLFVGASFIMMLAIVTLSSLTILDREEDDDVKDSPIPEVTTSTPIENTNEEQSESLQKNWMGMLDSKACDSPCSGGEACATPSSSSTERCISGATCIPGSPATQLNDEDVVALHLSAIYWGKERTRDPCKTQRDLWVCVEPSGSPDSHCFSQLEACQQTLNHAAISQEAITLTGTQLMRDGVTYTVRKGGPAGRKLISKTHALGGGLLRLALCKGVRIPLEGKDKIAFIIKPATQQ